MNGGGACSYLCTKVKGTSRNMQITGGSSYEQHYETVGEGHRSNDKKRGDNCRATIWVHARKKYHRRNLLVEDAVGKVD